MNRVIVRMKNGDTHFLRGWSSDITRLINDGRDMGALISVERDTIPTGEMMSLDPDEVSSVRDDR